MILSFTSDKWCAQALHTDPNAERFYHVTLWVLAKSVNDAEEGAWFVIDAMCKGRVHYIRAEPEVAQHQAKMFQGYARFSYALEAGERITEEPEENWQLSLAP